MKPALALLLMLAAVPAAAQDADALAQAHANCLVREARRLDDGTSDAAAIARGVAPNCAPQFRAMIQAWGQRVSPAARPGFMDKARTTEHDRALHAVLEVRAQRRR